MVTSAFILQTYYKKSFIYKEVLLINYSDSEIWLFFWLNLLIMGIFNQEDQPFLLNIALADFFSLLIL